jgi:phosphoribosyl 1,2-cyclic phosphodiesterase
MASKPRILIADESEQLLHAITKASEGASYQIETAKNGPECLKKLETFSPDLLIVDLMLPKMHGIEILHAAKKTPKLGVIISCYQPMLQNFHAAISSGADYFLNKPFEMKFLFDLIKRFFSGILKPDPFVGKPSGSSDGEHCYVPQIHHQGSYLKFWGTRGSTPVSGPQYVRYGGNTPCLEIRSGNDVVIIDAGTGVRPLGRELQHSHQKKYHLLLSHTHWDHLIGFPFFSPIYDPEAEIHIYVPVGFSKTSREVFFEILTYAYFPVRLDDIKAKLIYHDLRDGDDLNFGSINIKSHYAFHPGSTLCFKIAADGHMFGYVTDDEFLMGYHGDPKTIKKNDPLLDAYQSLIAFLEGCHAIVHEAQYFPQEYQNKVGWGHSSVTNAALLIKLCQCSEWIATHHNPSHTDDDLLKKLQLHIDTMEHLEHACRIRLAFDEFTLAF